MKEKKSKIPTIFFSDFFFQIFFFKVWSGIKSLIFGLKLAIFLVTVWQRVALPQGGKDFEKLNFFYFIRFSIYCKIAETFCEFRRTFYLSFLLFILCAKFGGHTILHTTVGRKSNLKAKLRVVSLFSSQPAFSPSMENRLTGKK